MKRDIDLLRGIALDLRLHHDSYDAAQIFRAISFAEDRS